MFKRNSGFGGGEKRFGGRSQGDRSYGGARSGGYGVRDDARPQLHKATCAGCGEQCEVPFKPNGSRPIFCRNCFKRDENAAPKRFDRPSFGDKRPSLKSYGDRPQQAQPDTSRIEARLAAIETKIDALIDALTADDEDEDGEEQAKA